MGILPVFDSEFFATELLGIAQFIHPSIHDFCFVFETKVLNVEVLSMFV